MRPLSPGTGSAIFETMTDGVTLLVGLAVTAAISALAYLENNWIAATTYDISPRSLPPAFHGFRILQISDLHNQRFGPFQSRFLRIIREARPDLIAVTGDMCFQGKFDAAYGLRLLHDLRALAPTYLVTGNHDVLIHDLPRFLARIRDTGVEVLRGAHVTITRANDRMVVAGVDDPRFFTAWGSSRHARMEGWETQLAAIRRDTGPDVFTILLSHRPEHIARYARHGFNVVLTGHAHGGQMRIPGIGALYAPGQGKLPRYASGTHVVGATTEVVSRGLGGSVFPFRVLNRPEVVIIRLTRPPPTARRACTVSAADYNAGG